MKEYISGWMSVYFSKTLNKVVEVPKYRNVSHIAEDKNVRYSLNNGNFFTDSYKFVL